MIGFSFYYPRIESISRRSRFVGRPAAISWSGSGASRLISAARSRASVLSGVSLYSCLATEARSEEHTSELQSLMRISYAVFCLKKKKKIKNTNRTTQHKTSTKTQLTIKLYEAHTEYIKQKIKT